MKSNKIVLLLGLTLFSVCLIACRGEKDPITDITQSPVNNVKVASVSVSSLTLNLVEGDEQTITVTIYPTNATNKNCSFSSSDPDIVTVNENGKITAKKVGEATITVTTLDSNKTATCKVTVSTKPIPVDGVVLDKMELSLEEEQTETIVATISPENATNKNLIWKSADDNIVLVDETGKITAVNVGQTTITATTEDGNKTAMCKVTVKDKTIPVESISTSTSSIEIVNDYEWDLNEGITILPENATNKNVVWSSSDENVVSININIAKAVGEGVAILTGVVEGTDIKTIIEVNVSEVIAFEDEQAKAFCIVYFDKNHDGKLSKAEAAAVTYLPKDIYGDNAFYRIFTFKEFQYFTSIEEIPNKYFNYHKYLSNIILPENIKSIGERAFEGCNNLTNINIPDKVSIIKERAFSGCRNLTSIIIPGGVETIEDFAFDGCFKLDEVIIQNGVRYIGEYAFAECNISNIVIPNSITYIGDNAFRKFGMDFPHKNLSVTIENGIETIWAGSFSESNCNNINIPKSITEIGAMAFYGCSFKEIIIPGNVKKIGNSAFGNNHFLEKITIDNGVTTIGDYAFSMCKISSITIPSSVTKIGSWVFKGCAIKEVTILANNPPEIPNYGGLKGVFLELTIYVPSSAIEKYKENPYWEYYYIKAIPE